MLTTAAGTIRPAQVLVIGAGVAGLQAIATARRLGAVVEAYDVRSATREQVKSLGAKFVETGVSAEGSGGYARELTAEEKRQAAGGARRAHRRRRRGRHHRLRARAPGAEDHLARRGRAHAPGRGDRRHRRRAGRQLRAHPRRRDRRCTRASRSSAPVNLPAQLAYNASEMYARNLSISSSPPSPKRRARDRLERRGVRAVLPDARRRDQARADAQGDGGST